MGSTFDIEERILKDVKNAPKGVTIEYIYQAHRIPKSRVRDIMNKLVEEDKVIKVRSKLGNCYFEKKEV